MKLLELVGQLYGTLYDTSEAINEAVLAEPSIFRAKLKAASEELYTVFTSLDETMQANALVVLAHMRPFDPELYYEAVMSCGGPVFLLEDCKIPSTFFAELCESVGGANLVQACQQDWPLLLTEARTYTTSSPDQASTIGQDFLGAKNLSDVFTEFTPEVIASREDEMRQEVEQRIRTFKREEQAIIDNTREQQANLAREIENAQKTSARLAGVAQARISQEKTNAEGDLRDIEQRLQALRSRASVAGDLVPRVWAIAGFYEYVRSLFSGDWDSVWLGILEDDMLAFCEPSYVEELLEPYHITHRDTVWKEMWPQVAKKQDDKKKNEGDAAYQRRIDNGTGAIVDSIMREFDGRGPVAFLVDTYGRKILVLNKSLDLAGQVAAMELFFSHSPSELSGVLDDILKGRTTDLGRLAFPTVTLRVSIPQNKLSNGIQRWTIPGSPGKMTAVGHVKKLVEAGTQGETYTHSLDYYLQLRLVDPFKFKVSADFYRVTGSRVMEVPNFNDSTAKQKLTKFLRSDDFPSIGVSKSVPGTVRRQPFSAVIRTHAGLTDPMVIELGESKSTPGTLVEGPIGAFFTRQVASFSTFRKWWRELKRSVSDKFVSFGAWLVELFTGGRAGKMGRITHFEESSFVVEKGLSNIDRREYYLGVKKNPPDDSVLTKKGTGNIAVGWLLEVLFFNTDTDMYCVRRTYLEATPGTAVPKQRAEFYLVNPIELLQLMGKTASQAATDLLDKYKAMFGEPTAESAVIPPAELLQEQETPEQEGQDVNGETTPEEEEKKPENAEAGPDKPTEHVPPTNKKETGEEGGTDVVQFPSGAQVPKQELAPVVADVMSDMADQLRGAKQTAPTDEQKPEEPEEEEEEKPQPEQEPPKPEEQQAPAQAPPQEVQAATAPAKNENLQGGSILYASYTTPTLRRLLGTRKAILLGECQVESSRLSAGHLGLLARVGSGEPMTLNEAMRAVETVRALPLNHALIRLVECADVFVSLSRGNFRRALQEALEQLRMYEKTDVAIGVAQLNNLVTTGDFLLEAEDETGMEAMMTTPEPAEEPEDVDPEIEDLANGVNTVMSADKMVAAKPDLPAEVTSTVTAGEPGKAITLAQDIEPEEEPEAVAGKIAAVQNEENEPASVPEVAAAIPNVVTEPEDDEPLPEPEDMEVSDHPVAVEINNGVADEEVDTAYEAVLIRAGKGLCEVAVNGQVRTIPTSRVRALAPGADLATCLSEAMHGGDIHALARRRLYSRVRAGTVLNETTAPNGNFLYLYMGGAPIEESLGFVAHHEGYIVGDVGIVPLKEKTEEERRAIQEEAEALPGKTLIIDSRGIIRENPNLSLVEQLEVPAGQEADVAATAFADGMQLLQAARTAIIDFQGHTGKIGSLVSLEAGEGKKTAKALDKIADECKDVLKAIKDVMDKYSEAHDAFTQEFPDAKAEPVAGTESPAPVAEQPAETPPEAQQAATPSEKPAEAPAEQKPAQPQEQPPAAPETKAESVARRISEKYNLSAMISHHHAAKIGQLVMAEEPGLTPGELRETMAALRSRLTYTS